MRSGVASLTAIAGPPAAAWAGSGDSSSRAMAGGSSGRLQPMNGSTSLAAVICEVSGSQR